ncbi:MAG: dienelactone hydrolase family protein [Desulfobacteraceae bacterium]|nr:dienelactone hydrolase family protein [Desulfobacteraceae bacterium]
MIEKEFVFKIENDIKFNSILTIPDSPSEISAVIAHGANNDMNTYILKKFSDLLGEAGIPTLRFNFPYRYENKTKPDSSNILKKAWIAAYNFMRHHKSFPSKKMLAAGKSLGGRIASELAASNYFAPDLMVFLGYPLHQPGKPEKANDSSLYLINCPVIFASGTKDPLCNKNLLEKINAKMGTDSHLYFIENAGHSLTTYNMNEDEAKEHYNVILTELREMIFRLI